MKNDSHTNEVFLTGTIHRQMQLLFALLCCIPQNFLSLFGTNLICFTIVLFPDSPAPKNQQNNARSTSGYIMNLEQQKQKQQQKSEKITESKSVNSLHTMF